MAREIQTLTKDKPVLVHINLTLEIKSEIHNAVFSQVNGEVQAVQENPTEYLDSILVWKSCKFCALKVVGTNSLSVSCFFLSITIHLSA